MDDVKKKVLLDVFASPWTLLPLAAGVSAWLVSWGIDGNMWLNLAGLAGVLGGLGAQASRLIFGLEKFTADAYALVHEKERAQQEAALDALAERLRRDGDPRTEQCLAQLRGIYREYQTDVQGERINSSTHAILDKLENLFRAAVQQLAYSLDLWQESRKMSGNARASLQRKRESVVKDVIETVRHVQTTTEQFRTFQLARSDDQLSILRDELDATIRVARRAEERMAGWSDEIQNKSPDANPTEFE